MPAPLWERDAVGINAVVTHEYANEQGVDVAIRFILGRHFPSALFFISDPHIDKTGRAHLDRHHLNGEDMGIAAFNVSPERDRIHMTWRPFDRMPPQLSGFRERGIATRLEHHALRALQRRYHIPGDARIQHVTNNGRRIRQLQKRLNRTVAPGEMHSATLQENLSGIARVRREWKTPYTQHAHGSPRAPRPTGPKAGARRPRRKG